MSSRDVLIRDCTFDAGECGRGSHAYYLADTLRVDALTYLIDNRVLCGHCHEVIYPEIKVLRDHRIVCNGDAQTWFAYDGAELLRVVHRCGRPALTATDEELLDLLAPASLHA